jgi:hypothetical protein
VEELHHVRYLLDMPFYDPVNPKTGKPAKKDKALNKTNSVTITMMFALSCCVSALNPHPSSLILLNIQAAMTEGIPAAWIRKVQAFKT